MIQNNNIKKFILQQKELYYLDGIYLPNNTNKNSFKKNITYTDKHTKHLNDLKTTVNSCTKCDLGNHRINAVFGEGNIQAKLMFIGEGPGYNEDRQGKPFVGRAGELLTKIIEAMNLKRQDVYITNIVKCHPMKINDPKLKNNDRPPNETEIETCIPYLYEQIAIIKPKIICCLGSVSAKVMTKNDLPISQLRGRIFNYSHNPNILIIPTYHPAALLRNPALKKYTWNDMKLILKYLIQ